MFSDYFTLGKRHNIFFLWDCTKKDQMAQITNTYYQVSPFSIIVNCCILSSEALLSHSGSWYIYKHIYFKNQDLYFFKHTYLCLLYDICHQVNILNFFFSVQNTDECINNTKIYGYIKNVFAAETLPMLLYSSLFLFLYIPIYKWSRVIHNRVLRSHRSKMSKMYMKLWKQCALLVITTMTLWQLMHLGTWCHVPK